ncbi:hypothetical protein EDB85DRAFT_1894393 [Lactarius pseudohatsudake]|nr:hypothetical protein EDB85DRAFT_1894393 [Lactarius pseudohatsudake]
MATKPVSGSRPVTPVEDPGCQSPSSKNSSEPAPLKTTRSKQDHTSSSVKAPSTRAAKAKSNRSAVTDGDDDVAAQPVSGSCPVTPVEDPGCQSPRWGAQIQNSSKPAPPLKMTRSKSDHASSSVKAPSTRAAKAKDSRSATDDDAAAQSQPKLRLVTPAEDPGHESPDQARMAPSSSEVLLRDELRQWVDEHKIELQGKRPTRIDLIKAIAGAAKSEQPSKEDIESIVTEVLLAVVSNKSVKSRTIAGYGVLNGNVAHARRRTGCKGTGKGTR